jgi:ATP-binding cassette subfamily C protein LapB
MAVLKATLRPEDTLFLVTHKQNLLGMTNRIIVIAQHQIIMDGPRDEVLRKLSAAAMLNTAQLEASNPNVTPSAGASS